MDNNTVITNFKNSAMDVCNLYKTMYEEISSKLDAAKRLQEVIMRNAPKYKVGFNYDSYDMSTLTGEDIYTSMSVREKDLLVRQMNFDLYDVTGNFKSFDDLGDDVKEYFNNQVEEIKTNRQGIEMDFTVKSDELLALDNEVKHMYSKHYNDYQERIDSFADSAIDLNGLVSKLKTEAKNSDRKKVNLESDVGLTDEERNTKINAENKRRKVINAKIGIYELIIDVHSLYFETFEDALNQLNENRIYDEKEREITAKNHELMNTEISIIEKVNALCESLTTIKSNYDKEYLLINGIEKELIELYKNVAAKTFVSNLRDILNKTKEQIYNIEKEDIYNIGVQEDMIEKEKKNDEPTKDEPTKDEPTKDEPTKDEPTKDEPTKDEPTKDEPTKDEPEEPTERQNQTVEYKVNRRRQASSAKRNLAMAALGVGLVAANGLGLAPVAGAVLSGGILAVAAAGIANGGLTAYKRAAATHKLKKIARKMRKEGLNIHLGKFDYENGTVEYMLRDEDGQDIPLKDADQDPKLIDALTDRLNKEFRNNQRGLHETASKLSKFEIDMQEMPKVTINNLEAAYAPIGGIRSFKDDVLGEAFSWDTHSSLIGKVKDSKFMRNIKDKEEQPVSEANLDDITNDQDTPKVEEEDEKEVTLDGAKQETLETQVQGTPITGTETPDVTSPEESKQETPEAQGQVPLTTGTETPDVQNPNTSGSSSEENHDTDFDKMQDELDEYSMFDDFSAEDVSKMSDEELRGVYAALNGGDIENAVNEIARAAEEESHVRGR